MQHLGLVIKESTAPVFYILPKISTVHYTLLGIL
jgi:hypothetical protein